MNITIEKQNLLQWIQGLTDEKIIERILSIKENNEVSSLENQLIQKGLEDISNGNVSSHEEVKKRFEAKFAKK
jgi:predicted transcriptional regulator